MRAAFSRLFKKDSGRSPIPSKSKPTRSPSSSQETDFQTAQRFKILHLWTGLILNDVDITSNLRPKSRDEAIRVLSGFLTAHPGRDNEKTSVREARWNCSLALCGALYQRALQFNAIQDFDATIARLETELTHIPAQHDLRPVFLQMLANALESRYDRQGQQTDNDSLISSLRELLGLQPPADDTFEASITLAYALTKRAEYSKDEQALDAAKLWLGKSMQLSPNDRRICTVQTNLGRVLMQHYERSSNLNYLRMAVSWLEQAVNSSPGLFEPLAHLGPALYRLFKQTRDIQDIDKAIARLRAAIQCIPPEYIDDILPQAHSDLAVAYLERHDVSKDIADIDQAVAWFRKATAHRRASQVTIWQASSALGRALIKRNQLSGDVHDLDEAISVLRRAESLGPGDSATTRFSSVDNVVADSLESLALALWARSNKSQAQVDFNEALKYQRKVIRLRPSLGTSNSLYLLIAILNDGLDRPNSSQSPDELIRWCNEAITRGQQGLEQRSTILDAHAKALLRKHEALGDIAYVNEAIEKQQEALRLRPEEPRFLINLEHHLARKFHVTADLHILDRRITLCRQGIKQSPADDKVLRSYALHALGDALAIRYKHLGVRLDFDEAIAAHSQGLDLRPPGDPNRWDSLLRLGLAYTEDPRAENKQLAIQSCRDALQCCSLDSPRNRAGILLHLSNCIVTQEEIGIQDIDHSIELCKEADTLYPQGLSHLLILVRMHGLRYDISQDPHDLSKAFRLLQDAHDTMPPDWSFRSVVLAMLALPYLIESQPSLPPPPRDPFEMVEEVVTSNNALLTEFHLHVATLWVQAARKSKHKSLLKAYRFALHNLEQWLTSYPTAEQQHSQVALRPHFASDACAAAISANDIEQAIELLEQGRGLLWARLTRYRQSLDTLREVNKELAEEFELAAKQLEQLSVSTYGNLSDSEVSSMTGVLSKLGLLSFVPGSQLMDTTGSSFIPTSGRQRELRLAEDLMGFDNRMRLLHDASSRWNDVIAQIRQIEGWTNFLRPSRFHDLQKAAAGGPIVIINVSADRCDAIIIRKDHSPALVPLPDSTPERFKELSQKLDENLESLHSSDYEGDRAMDHYRSQLKAVLRSLWTLVVEPISSRLEKIGYQNGTRVWWYPTGALCRLPLHAAGPYKRGQKNFHDLYISSYVTTLSSALKARQTLGTSDSASPNLLIIGVPGDDPTQPGYLPNVEEEVCTILDAVPVHLLPLQHVLVGELATSDAVQSELPRYAWAHFTCHGYQNPEPLNSSFQLYNYKDVKLIELVRSHLPKAQLAFLSACNTATGDFENTPDEVLHLAAVMQFCGFCSVIGTLWPMCDEDGPDVAREFYEFMFRDDGIVDFRDSADALHRAVQGLRRRKIPIERWINFVHFGL